MFFRRADTLVRPYGRYFKKLLFYQFPHAFDLGAHIFRRGTAVHLPHFHTAVERDCLVHIVIKCVAYRFIFFERQRFERHAFIDADGDKRTGRFIRVAERQALADKIVRAVGRVDESARGGFAHIAGQYAHRPSG